MNTINQDQRKILHEVMDQCIDITNQTDYDCEFEYVAHCKAYSVFMFKKGGTKVLHPHHVMTLKDWGEEERKRVSDFLDKFLALNNQEYLTEIETQEGQLEYEHEVAI